MSAAGWRPVRDLLAVGPIPRSKPKAIAWLRRAGVTLREVNGNGGKRIEVLVAELPEVQAELERRRAELPAEPASNPALHADYARLKAPAKRQAERRLAIAAEVERLVAAGASRSAAVEQAAAGAGRKARAVWKMLERLRGVPRRDWLPMLATRRAGPPAAEPAWAKPLLKAWRVPTTPDLTDVLEHLSLPEGVERPSYSQARRYLASLSAVERARGRLGPNALKSVRACVRRTFDGMAPGDCYISDGHTFDAEVMHPNGGQPCRPEVTCVLDVASRKLVGFSVALAESSWAVADALRHAVETHGVPAIWYADRGPGQQSAVLEQMLARLGITRERSIARNSQARGVIEAFNKNLIKAAKRLPTYLGGDMDADARRVVHLRTRRELRLVGASNLLMPWDDFLRFVAAEQARYNAKPHRSLGGLSPAEAWDRIAAEHGAPPQLDQAEIDDLARPYEVRTTRRGEVQIHGKRYFNRALEHLDGAALLVGYDVHDGARVWIKDLDERFLCVAELGANNAPYFPQSRIEQAREQRAKGRLRRLEARAEGVRAELAGQQAQAVVEPPVPVADPGIGAGQHAMALRLLERMQQGEELTRNETAFLILCCAALLTREARRNEKRRADKIAAVAAKSGLSGADCQAQQLKQAEAVRYLPYEVVEYTGTEDDLFFAKARWLDRRQEAGEELPHRHALWLAGARNESWYRSLLVMEREHGTFWGKKAS